jgi:hypothetical protein
MLSQDCQGLGRHFQCSAALYWFAVDVFAGGIDDHVPRGSVFVRGH